MLNKFKTLRRSTQVAIAFSLFLVSGVVVYAAISSLLSQSWTSNLNKGDLFEMELRQPTVTGTVTPGTSITVNPVVVNKGTKDALAYIRVTVPGIPDSSGTSSIPAYEYTVGNDWVLVEGSEGSCERVYGYSTVLGSLEETSALTDELVMVNMDTADFIGLSSVDFSFVGYLADCETYGRNVVEGWSLIRDGE